MAFATSAIWVLFALLSGSLPFSVWAGRYGLGIDVRSVGDGNPGATNVFRAGGRGIAAAALFLDFLKGALPVGLAAYFAKIPFPWLAFVAVAPVVGHAYSPLLAWRGGKAVAVTFGIWAGLTAWEGPVVLGAGLLAGSRLLGASGWAVLATLLLLGAYLIIVPPWPLSAPLRAQNSWLLVVLAGNLLLSAWKHRADFPHPPRMAR